MPRWNGYSPRLSSGALRRRELFCFLAFFQHAHDRRDRGTCLDGRGTGHARNQRLAEFLRVAQIWVGLDEWFLFHAQIIAEGRQTLLRRLKGQQQRIPYRHSKRFRRSKYHSYSALLDAVGKCTAHVSVIHSKTAPCGAVLGLAKQFNTSATLLNARAY